MRADVKGARRAFERPHRYLRNDSVIDLRRIAVRELLGDLRDARILDIGCGDGRVSLQFASANNRLTLVDLSEHMIGLARERARDRGAQHVEFVRSAIDDYSPAAPFDLVLCLGVIAHVPDVAEAIRRLADLVVPGGRLVLQLTDFDAPVGKALAWISRMKRVVSNPLGYAVNRTGGADVIRIARGVGLRPAGGRRYWPLLPGMGLMPEGFGRAFANVMFESPRLADLGSERVLLFLKD